MNDIESKVKKFYNDFPYPFPVTQPVKRKYFSTTFDFWPDGHRPSKILILGCGTSLCATYAENFSSAQIVGVDLSEKSIEVSRAFCEEKAYSNITHLNQSIDDFLKDNKFQDFDLISLTGVLHHMENREGLLSKIKNLLSPSGRLLLMIYGKHTSAPVQMLRDMFDILGLDPKQDQKKIKELISKIPSRHPAKSLITQYNDYDSLSGIMDMFYHPYAVSHNTNELLDLIDASGMNFYNWLYRSIYNYNYLSQAPILDDRKRWSMNELLNGNIGRHFVILSRNKETINEQIQLKSRLYVKIEVEQGRFLRGAPPELMSHKIRLNPLEERVLCLIKEGISVTELLDLFNFRGNISFLQMSTILMKFYNLDIINIHFNVNDDT